MNFLYSCSRNSISHFLSHEVLATKPGFFSFLLYSLRSSFLWHFCTPHKRRANASRQSASSVPVCGMRTWAQVGKLCWEWKLEMMADRPAGYLLRDALSRPVIQVSGHYILLEGPCLQKNPSIEGEGFDRVTGEASERKHSSCSNHWTLTVLTTTTQIILIT